MIKRVVYIVLSFIKQTADMTTIVKRIGSRREQYNSVSKASMAVLSVIVFNDIFLFMCGRALS